MINISKEELSEEEFEAVIASRGFQKMLLYQRLAEGIEVLQTHDRLYESMIQAITDQHSQIDSADTTQEVLSLLQHEVKKYTEPLTTDDDEAHTLSDKLVSNQTKPTTKEGVGFDNNAEKTLQEYLEERLDEREIIELKANEIASDIGLQSTHVGGILGRWRNSEDPPFVITASESASGGNLWTIESGDD